MPRAKSKRKISRFALEQTAEFSPAAFMRARRPELFSDSQNIAEPHVTKQVFEYHLETLTSRKEEVVFERFARRLAEKEICPNLLPQTGPTGGGDSKVDAETYPVAEAFSLRWYEGYPQANKERWAFAFSAKKDWRSKVRSDIKNISLTGRGYVQSFFITNQFVRDKDRSSVEADLEREYGLPVRILDRTWIVTSVFERDRLALAIETLNLQVSDDRPSKVLGPQDTERENALKELEDQIADSARYEGVDYQLAEDCLQSALLARGLERSEHEVLGRFERAERIADRLGHRQLQLRIVYNKAWTLFWWYEDYDGFNKLYDQVETLAVGSQQASDIELLGNVWTLLISSLRQGRINKRRSRLDARTRTLKSELDRLVADTPRRNNVLSARTNRLFIELTEAQGDQERLDSVFKELNNTILQAQGLIAYPVEAFSRIVRDLGDVFSDSSAFDELLETIATVTEERTSQGEGGRVLLERGYQKLEAEKPYEAIALFGRAQQKLALREYREELVSALVGCALAYERAGLLWAARASVLAAANQALSEYWEQGEIVPQAVSCLQKLVWIELQLGRIAHVLQWMETSAVIAEQVLRTETTKNRFIRDRAIQDGVLSILLLRVDFWQLKWLDFLPDVLERHGLDFSWMALLYALGHDEYLRVQGVVPADESSESADKLFSDWIQQPAANDLPDEIDPQLGAHVELRSFVLGCQITVRAQNNVISVQLAETILAALESLLATSLDAPICPFVSEFSIEVSRSESVTEMPTYKIDEGDLHPTLRVAHATNHHDQITSDYSSFRKWLEDLIIHTVVRITFISDIDSWGTRLFRDEGGMGRALNFTESSIPIENVLGANPKYRLSDWERESKTKFALRRTSPWTPTLSSQPTLTALARYEPGSGDPPRELASYDNIKHKDRRIYSLINAPLWEKAHWHGMLYVAFPENNLPPYMALGFKNPEVGKSIFRGWRNRLGQVDQEEALKITIVTGIDKDYPASYRVAVGTNAKVADNDPSSIHSLLLSRFLRMDPDNLSNLDRFRRQYEEFGKYVVIPAHYPDSPAESTPFFDLGIVKSEVTFRSAWEIGKNDLDSVAITDEDNPIIPDNVPHAPVLGLLAKLQERPRSKRKLPKEISDFIAATEDLSDDNAVERLFEYLSKDTIKGHWPCYCGGGDKLRNCHFAEIKNLRHTIDRFKAKTWLQKFRAHR